MNATYTNTTGIPEPLAEAIKLVSEKYSTGESDFTTTELTAPPRIRALRKRLAKAKTPITSDVSDMMHSVMGSAVHYILEDWSMNHPDYISEERLYRDFNGFKIGGQLDLYNVKTGTLWDWKYTKSTTYREGVKAEYIQQLNINAWLLRGNDHNPKTLYSAPIYRDFSKMTCEVKPPHKHAEEWEVEMWPDEAVENFLRKRIELHRQAEADLPLCTEDERWATKSVWAAQSLKSGRAIKHGLCATEEEAEQKRKEHKNPSTLGVIHRLGKCGRCAHYCSVASVCDQWKNDLNNPANHPQKELAL